MFYALIPIAALCLWPGQRVVSYLTRHRALAQIRATEGTVYEGELGYALKLDRSQLVYLSGLSDVGGLDLSEASLTDVDLSHLRPLRELVFLDLSSNPISDAGIDFIEHCLKLRFLALQDNAITSHGLSHVAKMTDLENLLLDGTRVSDDGLKHLINCNKLRELSLYDTEVTAAAIKHLSLLPSLSMVSVPKEWSVDSVTEFKAKCPGF